MNILLIGSKTALVFLCVLSFLFLPACQSESNEHESGELSESIEMENLVDVMVLEETDFTYELVSNGKLRAKRKSRLRFNTGEELLQLNVSNGSHVEAGEILAVLNRENLKRQFNRAKIQLQRASMDLEDILVGRGYTLKDSLNIPKDIMQTASIRSGYAEALNELENIKANLENTRIIAPYSGIIADIEVREYEQVNTGDVFCYIIDNSVFIVEFSVMEDELSMVEEGKKVEVMPFSKPNESYKGTITSVNPIVDEHGQIKVTALVKDAQMLKDGMNVRVLVKDHVPNQLVVPKSSVLYRDNLEVLFKYENGKAHWTYVHTLMENSRSYAVKANPDRVASLEAGDTVIVSNNLNLAHGSLVVVDFEE